MNTVCVDAMGGDLPSGVVLSGIDLALAADHDLEVLVAGDACVVEPFCASHGRAVPLVTTEVIAMDEHPATAVRAKRDSSIVRGCQAVRAGDAQAFFSAGSTGAVLAAATVNVGRVKGVSRPALAAVLPGLDGHQTVFCDLGANADCRPEMLVQFAQMGAVLAQVEAAAGDAPSVGLLSNGTEDTKGSSQALEFHEALKKAAEGGLVNFQGNCEGSDILMGSLDVVVSDGFSGNIALKAMEGTAKFMAARLKAAAAASPRSALGALLVKPAFSAIAADLSGDVHGGACLLGLKAPMLVGHGHTSPEAVMNGTLAALRTVREDLCGRIAASLAQGA